MRFHADLHVHSRYSRATSKQADLEHLAYWAVKKGITVVGTGDFTHPAWRAELKEKLVPAEPGLFRLRPDIEANVDSMLPRGCADVVRFMLEVEISTIYKKGDLTRKIHHLIYVPDFDAADRLAASLGRIGNLNSDGRPILGLDSRHLLEITLEAGPGSYLIPAHIWTPWFAVLGARSGFDTVADCYGDLSDHIFAVETGLSSDPPMNWRVSFLDRYRLVSNSDAHSPAKLGREATTFDTEVDYFAIRRALETGDGFVGTVEFFPEEGKYHMDGHRKCGVRLTPEETKRNGGRCPVCGQPVTVGVQHRVDDLADRSEAEAAPPSTAGAVSSLVPLPEVLSEIHGSGPGSQKVTRGYERLVADLGSELSILETVPVEDIRRADSSLLAEAISRLRAGQVIRNGGYDGEYGVIRLFEDAELRRLTAGGLLFDLPAPQAPPRPESVVAPPAAPAAPTENKARPDNEESVPASDCSPQTGVLAALDADQRAAAATVDGPLLIVAGPGSGKTRTLTHRIAHLVAECDAPAAACLAITFTRRAAREMAERLDVLLPGKAGHIPIHTFHSLGLSILREHGDAVGLHRGFTIADDAARADVLVEALGVTETKARTLLRAISRAKRSGAPASDTVADAVDAYRRGMALRGLVDLDDLVGLALEALSSDPGLAALYRQRYRWVSVDEFQDLDDAQYRLIRCLAPSDANLCVIGDPDQAIYGFRGADAACFDRFRADYPDAAVVRLARNYRSSGTIVTASTQVIGAGRRDDEVAQVVRDMRERITIHAAASDRAEAEFVVQTIESLIGGHSLFSIDSGRSAGDMADLSFSDFAVLYRTDAQSEALCEALGRSGMPFQRHSHERLADTPVAKALLEKLDPAEDGPLTARLSAAAERLPSGTEGHDPIAVQSALGQLIGLAEAAEGDPTRFSEALALATEADGWDPRADRVSLMTLHAAKGLEFPVVFIVGLEDGMLPLQWGADDESAEEERRLFYVGMTRAEDRLFLSRANRRLWRGKVRELPPSPYLDAIERDLLTLSRQPAVRAKAQETQLALF